MAQDYASADQQTSSLAIVSLIAGIASWIIVPILGPIAAVITGHMAKREIRQSAGRLTGGGLATAGLVLGYLQIGLAVCGLCAIVTLTLSGPGISEVFSNITNNLQAP